MSADKCTLQYYYPTQELIDKYKINCNDKTFLEFENIKNFNNEEFLKFVNDKYGNSAFNGDSPFTFKEDYINETNEQICKSDHYSLKPQQKFVGQFINPATNFNNTLVFHGLGSGKTCTSLVIAEAFKLISTKKILFVVPAPLVDQYQEEILGELKNIKGENVLWSCTSQCVINGQRGEYSNVEDQTLLQLLDADHTEKAEQLKLLNLEINVLLRNKEKIEIL